MARVLAIDPDRQQPDLVAQFAQDAGTHDVLSVATWDEARDSIEVRPPDLILVAAQPQWVYWFKPTGLSESETLAAAQAFLEQTRTRLATAPAPRSATPVNVQPETAASEPTPPSGPGAIARLLSRAAAARAPLLDRARDWTPALLKIAATAIIGAALLVGGVKAAHWWSSRPSAPVVASTAPVETPARKPLPAKRATPKPRVNPELPVSAAEASIPGWLALFSPVELIVTEAGHEVRFDESSQAMLPPGRHELTLVNKTLGYREVRTVQLKSGVVTPVSIVLPKTTLTITAVPPADVIVDGTAVGQTPLTDLALELGTREIVLTHATYGQRRFTITATTKPVRLDVDLTKPAP